MEQYTGGGAFYPKEWAFSPFCVRLIKSFNFYDIIYITTKISVYQQFDVFMDHFLRVPSIGY